MWSSRGHVWGGGGRGVVIWVCEWERGDVDVLKLLSELYVSVCRLRLKKLFLNHDYIILCWFWFISKVYVGLWCIKHEFDFGYIWMIHKQMLRSDTNMRHALVIILYVIDNNKKVFLCQVSFNYELMCISYELWTFKLISSKWMES